MYHILVLIAICVVCSRCKHASDEEQIPCHCGEANSIESLKEWAYFKTGTYWIYQEETTLELDTFVVLNDHDFVTSQGNDQFDYEMWRTRDQYYYRCWFNEGWSALDCNNGCCECRRLWCSKHRPGDADGEEPLLTFPTYVGSYSYLGWAGGDYGKVEVVDYAGYYQIGNFLFTDVVIQLNTNSVLDQAISGSQYYESRIYFAKSIGIIRKEITETNEIWNLIEYRIEQ